jgi:hypothetical protein
MFSSSQTSGRPSSRQASPTVNHANGSPIQAPANAQVPADRLTRESAPLGFGGSPGRRGELGLAITPETRRLGASYLVRHILLGS